MKPVVAALALLITAVVPGQPVHQAPAPKAPEAAQTAWWPVLGPLVPPTPPQALRKPHRASRYREIPHGPTEAQWAKLRQCENGGRYTSRAGDHYRGAYQFDRSTWRSVGGSGDPAAAPPTEQDYRARLLYADRGRQPWPVCGRYLR